MFLFCFLFVLGCCCCFLGGFGGGYMIYFGLFTVLLFCTKLNFSLNFTSIGEHLLGLFETGVQVELDRARLPTKCRSCRSLRSKLDLKSLFVQLNSDRGGLFIASSGSRNSKFNAKSLCFFVVTALVCPSSAAACSISSQLAVLALISSAVWNDTPHPFQLWLSSVPQKTPPSF